MICNKRKLLYLHPPRNGGKSIEDVFFNNIASSGRTLFVQGFEQLPTDLSNSTFDCYSSQYQDVSEYWVKGELTEFNYEGSNGVEAIYTSSFCF